MEVDNDMHLILMGYNITFNGFTLHEVSTLTQHLDPGPDYKSLKGSALHRRQMERSSPHRGDDRDKIADVR